MSKKHSKERKTKALDLIGLRNIERQKRKDHFWWPIESEWNGRKRSEVK